MDIGDEVLLFGIIDGVSDDGLAHHFTEAGFNLLAIAYWQKAGEIARQRSANVEAVNHLTGGWRSCKMSSMHRTKFLKKLHYSLAGAMLGPNPWICIIEGTTSILPGLGVDRPD